MGLLALADQYDMAGLKSLCAVGLAARVTEDNYLEVMNLAQLHNMPLLKAAAVDYIAANAGASSRKRLQEAHRLDSVRTSAKFIVSIREIFLYCNRHLSPIIYYLSL